ncbi:MAG: hypothetical protein ABJ242_07870 [Marinomonas sp.]
MKPYIYLAPISLVAVIAVAACVPSENTQPVSTPTPTASQSRPVVQPLPQPVQQRFSNYLDAPQTRGNWSYQTAAFGSQALFAQAGSTPSFAFNCHRAEGRISLMQSASGQTARTMTVRTETTARTLTAQPSPNSVTVIRANLSANDRLLDAMAITKGRIAVETQGLPALYLPAWPEISRVIEDCR